MRLSQTLFPSFFLRVGLVGRKGIATAGLTGIVGQCDVERRSKGERGGDYEVGGKERKQKKKAKHQEGVRAEELE